ncbi:MAG: hypothetical protein ACMZ63_10330 [Methylotenera sp.]
MKFLVRTLLTILLTLICTACSEPPAEDTLSSNEDLIEAVEANAEIAPAEAMQEMKLEVEETADEIIEEIPLVTPEHTTLSE